jgi:hypothetical protein
LSWISARQGSDTGNIQLFVFKENNRCYIPIGAATIYPDYHAEASVRDILAGTLYALVDGAIAGLLFACTYNLVAGGKESPA